MQTKGPHTKTESVGVPKLHSEVYHILIRLQKLTRLSRYLTKCHFYLWLVSHYQKNVLVIQPRPEGMCV